jgi:hypothetical protein
VVGAGAGAGDGDGEGSVAHGQAHRLGSALADAGSSAGSFISAR